MPASVQIIHYLFLSFPVCEKNSRHIFQFFSVPFYSNNRKPFFVEIHDSRVIILPIRCTYDNPIRQVLRQIQKIISFLFRITICITEYQLIPKTGCILFDAPE